MICPFCGNIGENICAYRIYAAVSKKYEHRSFINCPGCSAPLTIPELRAAVKVYNAQFEEKRYNYLLNECPQIKTIIAAGHNGIVYKMSVGSGKRLDMSSGNKYNDIKRKFRHLYDFKTGDLEAITKFCNENGWSFSYE